MVVLISYITSMINTFSKPQVSFASGGNIDEHSMIIDNLLVLYGIYQKREILPPAMGTNL